jgi:hypothetical protein
MESDIISELTFPHKVLINYKGENATLLQDEAGRHYLSQVIKLHIPSKGQKSIMGTEALYGYTCS